MTISRWNFLRMTNVSAKRITENLKTQFLFSDFLHRKSWRLRDNVEKKNMAQPDRPQMVCATIIVVEKQSSSSSSSSSVICQTTGPKPLPKQFLHIAWTRVSSFNWKYPLLSLRSSSSFLRLLPHLLVTSICTFIFPSRTCCRRQFLRKIYHHHHHQ